MNLNQVTLAVSNLHRSIAFYEKIGLKLIVHTHDRYARFEYPDGQSTLSLHVEDGDIRAGHVSLYFETNHLEEDYNTLKAKDIAFERPPKDQSWLWREAWFRDPDGHRLCLFHAGKARRHPPWRKTN